MKLWNINSGQELRSFDSTADTVAMTPDGKHIVSGSKNGTIKLWDIK
jgi:WD40 repeat protein